MRSFFRSPVLIALVIWLCAEGGAWAQCALCRESLKSGGSSGLIQGFYWSIVLLLTVPALILTTLGWLLYRGHKRAIAAQSAGPSLNSETD